MWGLCEKEKQPKQLKELMHKLIVNSEQLFMAESNKTINSS